MNPLTALLAGKLEDRFTQYLTELLRDTYVLSEFLKLIGIQPKTLSPSDAEIRFHPIVAGGMPDLSIRFPNVWIVVESKLDSWFHDGQIESYLRGIEDWAAADPRREATLLLLTPRAGSARAIEEAREKADALSMNRTQIAAISWEAVAVFCRRVAGAVDQPRLQIYLEDLANTLEHQLGGIGRPFTEKEASMLADPLAAAALALARQLVTLTKEALEARQGYEATISVKQGYEGFDLYFNKRRWWFGLWYAAWPQVGLSPLMLEFPGLLNRVPPQVPNHIPAALPVSFGRYRAFVAPLAVRADVEIQILAQEHAKVVATYCEKFPETGEP